MPAHTWTIQTTAKDVWNKLSLLFDASRNANSHWRLVSVCLCVWLWVWVWVGVVVGVGVAWWVGDWVFAILFVEERAEI